MACLMRKCLQLHFLVPFLAALSMPGAARAQLVGDTAPQQLAGSQTESQPAAQTASRPTGKKRLAKDFTLQGDSLWTDTGVDLQPGEHAIITAKGTLRYADAKEDNGPEGLTRNFKDLIRILPYNDAGRGAVIAKIGDPDIAQPFLIGSKKEVEAPIAGKLSLGINQANSDTGTGSYKVKV